MRQPRLDQLGSSGLDTDEFLLAQSRKKLDEKERAAAGRSAIFSSAPSGVCLQDIGRELCRPGLVQRAEDDLRGTIALQPVHRAPNLG